MNIKGLYIPLSALQHFLFCPRQYALIHNEQVWADNQFTAEGQVLHKKANEGPDEHRASGKIFRHLQVGSENYGIYGICDIVEQSSQGNVIPVEYKRGKPKAHQADEVQLCAQALCLEEMFQTEIPVGHIFYGKNRRRTEVSIDEQLRKVTKLVIIKARAMKDAGITPSAEYDGRKCDACSLLDLCKPKAMRFQRGASSWFTKHLQKSLES